MFNKLKKYFVQWPIPLFLSVTLGLAPFKPEPHIWGKLKWIAGGAHGMGAMDWGDAVFHGFPWVWLLMVGLFHLWRKISS